MKQRMSVLLINPDDIRGRQRWVQRTPFAGLAYIAAYLQSVAGDDVSVEVVEMLPQRMTLEQVCQKVKTLGVKVCGITSKTYNFPFALETAKAIQKTSPETLILFGGAHPTALPHQVLENTCIHGVIPREGEIPFKNVVLRVLGDDHPFRDVKGVIYRDGDEIVENTQEELIQDLDSLPVPDWGKLYDLRGYDGYYDDYAGRYYRQLPIFASRGCPYGCHFCQPVLTRRYRSRSVDSVIAEMELLAGKHRIKRIYFEDSIFGLKKDWFMSFCSRFMERGLHKKVSWGFETNVNCVDEDRMRAAREANCVYVYFGMESASDVVLEGLGKGATKAKHARAVEICKRAGIPWVTGSFIFGLPGETSQTARETLDFVAASNLDGININLLDVYPGTKLYDMVERGEGGIRWIPEKRNKWDSCGRTLVKTLVNDLDSEAKLSELFLEAQEILHKKYKRNPLKYIRKLVKQFLYNLIHNPKNLQRLLKDFLKIHSGSQATDGSK